MKLEVAQEAFENVSGNTFVGIDTVTDVKLTGGKKNPLQGRVQKRMLGASVQVFSNQDSNGYSEMVRRRLVKEGKDPDEFKLGVRPWGTRIDGTPFVEHKGKHYIEVIFLKPGKTEYLVDGVVTPEEEIEGLPAKKAPAAESQGGLEDKVTIRTFALDGVTEIRANKQVWS